MTGLVASTTEFTIGDYGLGGQDNEGAALNNGTYVVTWTNTVNAGVPIAGITDTSLSAVFARIIGADGVPIGEAFQVNTNETWQQHLPEVTALSGGGFVIAWTELDIFAGVGLEAKAQVYDANGVKVGGELTLATSTTDDQQHPRLAATEDGGFLALWLDERTGDLFDGDVYGQYFTSMGAPNGTEFIAYNSANDIGRMDLVVLDNGDVRLLSDAELWQSNGVATGGSWALTAPATNDTIFAQQFDSDMAEMTSGRYAIAGVWNSLGASGDYDIALRVYDSTNLDNPVGSQLTVSDTGFGIGAQNLVGVDVTGTADGGVVVVWAALVGTDYNIYAQAYDASLNKLGGNTLVHSNINQQQTSPFVTQGANGQILIGWSEAQLDGTYDTIGRLFTVSDGTGPDIIGTSGNDALNGTVDAETILGMRGDDSIRGLQGNDILEGGNGHDKLQGNANDDILRGGNARDILKGGSGADTLYGDAGIDRLEGGIGRDTLWGGADGDTFIFKLGFGKDVIRDFEDDIDTIQLQSALWGGGLSEQDVLDIYGSVINGNVVLDFGGGNEIKIKDFTDINALVDDLAIV